MRDFQKELLFIKKNGVIYQYKNNSTNESCEKDSKGGKFDKQLAIHR